MRRAAHPSGCARCGDGAGYSAMKYQSLTCPEDIRVALLGEVRKLHAPRLRGVEADVLHCYTTTFHSLFQTGLPRL